MLSLKPPVRFLDQIALDHGPAPVLAHMFVTGDMEARRRGLVLSVEPLDSVAEVNTANRKSWLPLFPTYDPQFWRGADDSAFAIVGRNAAGDIVVTQALRVFDWSDTDFATEAEDLRLLYQDPLRHRLDGESCVVSAERARSISGRVAFSGGIWCRPDYRGLNMTALMVRLGRALAIGRYNIDINTAMMSETVYNTGLWRQVGHRHIDQWITMIGSRLGSFRLKFMWLSAAEVMDDLADYLGGVDGPAMAEVDATITQRHAH